MDPWHRSPAWSQEPAAVPHELTTVVRDVAGALTGHDADVGEPVTQRALDAFVEAARAAALAIAEDLATGGGQSLPSCRPSASTPEAW